jgi:polar amino acid transport system permease protein
MIDITVFYKALPYLLRGAVVTIEIAVLSCAIGLTLGTIIGLLQSGSNTIINFLINIFVTVIRGTPMLIQIAFVYFVLPELGIMIPDFWAAVVAIGLNSSAYVSQTIRSGIAAVSKGQREAAHVLGLSKFQTTRYIILPQALAVVLPALGNELITLVKDSSLASTIGVMELTKEGSIIKSQTFDALTIYCAVALFYLVMTSILSYCVSRLEVRMNRHVGY